MPVAAIEHRVLSAPDGRWEMRSMTPGDDLCGLVLGYQGYVERGGPVLCQREVSTTVIPVIVNFGPPFRVAPAGGGPRDLGSFVAGFDSGHATVTATGASRCMQVDLTPPGAYRFFGLPMRELAGDVVPLGELLGRDSERLACRLDAAADWPGRFAIVDEFVRARLLRWQPPSAEVTWAWQQLRASHGGIRIGVLADRLGWSRKHLAARFTTEIGRPPKTVASLLRFERLHRLVGQAAAPDWSALAYDCGYADQAHLVREFRRFAGTTPTDYVSERRVPGIGDDAR
jgi:AraC-like DNA-binding protein